MNTSPDSGFPVLRLKYLGIDTYTENVIFLPQNSPVCISEGLEALSRVVVTVNGVSIIASLNIIKNGILEEGWAGLSENAWKAVNAREGDHLVVSHLQPVSSTRDIRAKIYGKSLDEAAFIRIITDLVSGKYSNIEIAAFITACAGDGLNVDEMTSLTKAMIKAGQKLSWPHTIIADKHCVGGLPGNRTTPIVVAIVAAAGLTIPKTSSRAITSPAGTSDTMETMTRVNLSLEEIKKVVEKEKGCFVWGGSVKISPADDMLIKIERALDIDSEGQMIASVLSKKAAAGSTHVMIDIPVGPTAKVRTVQDGEKLKHYFKVVGDAIGINVKVLITDGSQPVGRGIGPVLEAIEVLKVLRSDPDAAIDLRERSLLLASRLLEFTNHCAMGQGYKLASSILLSGQALQKFMAICEAQGGFTEPRIAGYTQEIYAEKTGILAQIDNRRIAKVAKLAGAPKHPSAGVWLHVAVGARVKEGDRLYTIYAEHSGDMQYVLDYVKSEKEILLIR